MKENKISATNPAAFLKNPVFITLMVLALVTRFFYFNHPPGIVFDEVHFGKFVRAYETGENYFDIHPPLGKLLIFGFGKLGGVTLGEDFDRIGQQYDTHDLFVLRFLPTLMSALFVGIIYIFTLLLTGSTTAAGIAGALVLFENAIMVQSRFILLDIFLLSFAFLSYIFFLLSERTIQMKNQILLLILSGLFFGASFSIKWTGLASIVLIGLLALRGVSKLRELPALLSKLIIICVAALAVYCGAFWIHFSLLDKPGPGDAFLSPTFKEKSFISRMVDLNSEMYAANERLRVEHPFASKWYEWPLDKKAIFFWQNTSPPETGSDSAVEQQIWLFGNPVGWLFGLLGVVFGSIYFVLALITRKFKDSPVFVFFLLLTTWTANILPFSHIDRPLFLYHYFFPLIFSLILFAVLSDHLLEKFKILHKKTGKRIVGTGLALIIAGFLLVAPVTYGMQFTQLGGYQQTLEFFIQNGIAGVILFPKYVWELTFDH